MSKTNKPELQEDSEDLLKIPSREEMTREDWKAVADLKDHRGWHIVIKTLRNDLALDLLDAASIFDRDTLPRIADRLLVKKSLITKVESIPTIAKIHLEKQSPTRYKSTRKTTSDTAIDNENK